MEATLCYGTDTFAESDAALDRTWNATLEQKEVFVDTAVSAEASHGSDVLVGHVLIGRAGSLLSLGVSDGFAQSLDALVVFTSMVVTVLTCPGHALHHASWMPGPDAGYLTQSLVRLPWKAAGAPSRGGSLETLPFGDRDGVEALSLLKDSVDRHLLLHKLLSLVDLLGYSSSVDLHLHDVSLLLSLSYSLHPSVHDRPNYHT